MKKRSNQPVTLCVSHRRQGRRTCSCRLLPARRVQNVCSSLRRRLGFRHARSHYRNRYFGSWQKSSGEFTVVSTTDSQIFPQRSTRQQSISAMLAFR